MKTSLLLTWLSFQLVHCSIVQLRKNTLEKLLKGYDFNLRPFNLGSVDSPTQINVNLFISDIFDVSDARMEYKIQVYLREIWSDPRLRYPDPEGIIQNLPLGFLNRVWTPDLFFNEREGHFHNVQRTNRFVRIFPTGKVSFNTRITLKLHCPMDFKYFPFDRQICGFELESYGFETRDISLKWIDGNPLQVNSKLKMSNFDLEDLSADYCDKPTRYGNGCLSVKLQIKRQYGFYLTQIFVPYVLLVAVSWLSLWLDPRAAVIRLPLIVILLFMMFMMYIAIQDTIPTTHYTKAIDVWTATCISLVFATLLQFMLVYQFAKRERRVRFADCCYGNKNMMRESTQSTHKSQSALENCTHHHIPLSKRIDFTCRVLFPVAFVIFNCIYWFTYIKGKDNRHIIK